MTPTANHYYPRALPFRPPPNTLPWWRRYWLLATAAIVIVSGVAGMFVATKGGPSAPAPPNERMLETLGGLCASHLYQSYLNIGLVADAVEHETYTAKQAQEMLATVVGLMDVVDRQLDRLAKNDLSADDQRAVERIRALSALLRVQVMALRAFWTTGDVQQATRYHEAREKAWQGLNEVLQL